MQGYKVSSVSELYLQLCQTARYMYSYWSGVKILSAKQSTWKYQTQIADMTYVKISLQNVMKWNEGVSACRLL
jgi:hypothetical protein